VKRQMANSIPLILATWFGAAWVGAVGKRLDGWPNVDLDPGAIIALSPALTAEQKAVYGSWGKGDVGSKQALTLLGSRTTTEGVPILNYKTTS
jgi:hypothetical protein